MHESGYLTTYNGVIIEHNPNENRVNMNQPVIVVDLDCGTLLKVGDASTSGIQSWYATAVSNYIDSGLVDVANSLKMISFDNYNGILDIDGICTIINYMYNTIGAEKMNKLLNMSPDELQGEVKKLQELGF